MKSIFEIQIRGHICIHSLFEYKSKKYKEESCWKNCGK